MNAPGHPSIVLSSQPISCSRSSSFVSYLSSAYVTWSACRFRGPRGQASRRSGRPRCETVCRSFLARWPGDPGLFKRRRRARHYAPDRPPLARNGPPLHLRRVSFPRKPSRETGTLKSGSISRGENDSDHTRTNRTLSVLDEDSPHTELRFINAADWIRQTSSIGVATFTV